MGEDVGTEEEIDAARSPIRATRNGGPGSSLEPPQVVFHLIFFYSIQ